MTQAKISQLTSKVVTEHKKEKCCDAQHLQKMKRSVSSSILCSSMFFQQPLNFCVVQCLSGSRRLWMVLQYLHLGSGSQDKDNIQCQATQAVQGNTRSTLLCTSVRYFGTKHRVNVVEIKAQTGGRFSQMRKSKFTCGNGDAVCFYKHLKKRGSF